MSIHTTRRSNAFSSALLALLLSGCAGERYHRTGLELLAQGKTEEGMRSLEQANKEEPDNILFRRDLITRREEQADRLLAEGDSALATGRLDVAQAAYQRVQTIMPGNSRAAERLETLARERRYAPILEQADVSIKKGDLDQAQSVLRAVLAEHPNNTQALAMMRTIDDQQIRERITEPLLRLQQTRPVRQRAIFAPFWCQIEHEELPLKRR